MRVRTRGLLLAMALALPLLAACSDDKSPGPATAPAGGGSVVALTILQMNDVYELTPVSGGMEGGLARVATLRANLRAENPNTFTVLAGDLLNPSALSTAMVDGQRLAGRQMVDVMNILGLDYATFGNHEFDLSQENLALRLAESKFTWVSSNVTQADGQPFANVPANVTFTARNDDGQEIRIGLFGLTVGSNAATYVAYRDPVAVAKEQVAALRSQVDILIAVTHLSLEGDIDRPVRPADVPGAPWGRGATGTAGPARCGEARPRLLGADPADRPPGWPDALGDGAGRLRLAASRLVRGAVVAAGGPADDDRRGARTGGGTPPRPGDAPPGGVTPDRVASRPRAIVRPASNRRRSMHGAEQCSAILMTR